MAIAEYTSKLENNSIKFTSRASVKIRDSFYTFEACIEKVIPPSVKSSEISWDTEKQILWDECNSEVDGQIEEIVNFLKTKR